MGRGSRGSRSGDEPIGGSSQAAVPMEELCSELEKLRVQAAEAQATLEHQRRLLEAVPGVADVALVEVDHDGRCRVTGGRHQALLGQTYVDGPDGCIEAVGTVFDADGHRLVARDDLPSVRATRGEEFEQLQIWIGADPRTRRAFSVTARVLRDDRGLPAGAVLAYRDVDEFARTQALHDEFLRSMSHELRTPLASVLGRLELLAEWDDLPADVSRLVFGAHRNADRLSHLVADMLEAVEVREGGLSLDITPTDVAHVVRSSVRAAEDAAQTAGITIGSELPQRLVASVDGGRLRQALDHLIGNALKFTDPGGAITVRASRDGQQVVLDVSDTGVGLGADEAELAFGRFFRGRAAQDRAVGGTGIGLWVVRNVAEAHGGHATAERVAPEGTRFRVVLPDRAATASTAMVDDGGAGRRWRQSPDAAWVDRGDRVMALDLDRPGARPQALEGIAAVIWRLLDEPRTVDGLVQVLAGDFGGVGRDEMRRDVEQFLADLTVAGLTRVLDA